MMYCWSSVSTREEIVPWKKIKEQKSKNEFTSYPKGSPENFWWKHSSMCRRRDANFLNAKSSCFFSFFIFFLSHSLSLSSTRTSAFSSLNELWYLVIFLSDVLSNDLLIQCVRRTTFFNGKMSRINEREDRCWSNRQYFMWNKKC